MPQALLAPRRRIVVREMDGRHPQTLVRCPGSPRLRHDVSPSAKRRLHARIAYGRWMTLAAVQNLQKARMKRFVKYFKTLSTKTYLPVLFRRRRNVSTSGNHYLDTTWSFPDYYSAGTSVCEDLTKGSRYLRHP